MKSLSLKHNKMNSKLQENLLTVKIEKISLFNCGIGYISILKTIANRPRTIQIGKYAKSRFVWE